MAFCDVTKRVRIVELSETTTLFNDDKIALWSSDDNTTKSVSLQTLRNFVEFGDAGTLSTVINGSKILYKVPSIKEGDDTVSIPSIAGMSFSLSREGYPLELGVEYEILSAGGFKLLDSTLIEGQRYLLDVYELQGGQSVVGSASGGDGFIKGEQTVNTNVSISVNDLNKLFQVRGASNALNIILPDVSLCPEKSFVVIECTINNSKQHTISTTGGQYIYINNENKTSLHIGKGEYIWLYRTEDGWVVISEKGNFTNLAMPKAAYKVGLNQVLCDGSLLSRADYPRLWAYVQTLGSALVSDTTWSTDSVTVAGRTVTYPYRGCFSTGDGATNFRIPDLMNVVLRGLRNYGGSDTERHYNHPGGFQRNEFEQHTHNMHFDEYLNGNSGGPGFDGGNNQYETNKDKPTTSAGGTETRMDNVGVLWVIDY